MGERGGLFSHKAEGVTTAKCRLSLVKVGKKSRGDEGIGVFVHGAPSPYPESGWKRLASKEVAKEKTVPL